MDRTGDAHSSIKNELSQRTDTSAQFYHDPLGQLDTITAPAGTTRLQYDGTDFATRRYLVADERGSIIAVTVDSGNPVAINAYDEYGMPASTNQGRIQYTGQVMTNYY